MNTPYSPSAYRKLRQSAWDQIARKRDTWRGQGGCYHSRLAEIFLFLIPPDSKVIEFGCGEGDLLASLQPSMGVGIDFSSEMIGRARKKHSGINFVQADVHALPVKARFDFIILSDLVNDLWDVQTVLENTLQLAGPSTRIIINTYSRVWEMPLSATQKLGLSTPQQQQNWLTTEDISGLFYLADWELMRHWQEILFPLPVPLLSRCMNTVLVKIPPCNVLGLTNFYVARLKPHIMAGATLPSVSIVIPARNEAGNIERLIGRVPDMGSMTEIVFVEGGSTDNTYGAILGAIQNHPEKPCVLVKQSGTGKGDAVRCGVEKSSGDIIIILDADMTVPPEALPRFYSALAEGKGDFVNGVRLVYPMEKHAMPFFNLLFNKLFSVVFSWILGQPVRDTLCGTKGLSKANYERIARNRNYFGDFDPFGDFDLLLGAAKLHMKIVEIPVRYRERKYGETNISRWKDGMMLWRMTLFSMMKLKFR
jgi:ubiquinone/menaquinone biosynthesis C-methylase UbiE